MTGKHARNQPATRLPDARRCTGGVEGSTLELRRVDLAYAHDPPAAAPYCAHTKSRTACYWAPLAEPLRSARGGGRPALDGVSLEWDRPGLLATLVGDPDLLLLDEPTNGLDVDGVATLAGLLDERTAAGRAALVATHDRPFIERVAAASVEIRAGRVVLAG